jgi:Domain of unknown function (DUF6883)
MELPNAQSAIVEREKVVDYLLNPAHPDNGGKAQFFLALGFAVEEWDSLADALRRLALVTPVARYIESMHGREYVLEGPIDTPCGRTPDVRTVWIADHGLQTPRLVTAYPYR